MTIEEVKSNPFDGVSRSAESAQRHQYKGAVKQSRSPKAGGCWSGDGSMIMCTGLVEYLALSDLSVSEGCVYG